VWLFIQDRFVGPSQIANSFQDPLQGLEGMAMRENLPFHILASVSISKLWFEKSCDY